MSVIRTGPLGIVFDRVVNLDALGFGVVRSQQLTAGQPGSAAGGRSRLRLRQAHSLARNPEWFFDICHARIPDESTRTVGNTVRAGVP